MKLFFPEICFGCENILQAHETSICLACRHNLPLTNHAEYIENELYKSFYGKIKVEFAASLFYYAKESMVQKLIHAIKYKNQQQIGAVFGNWLGQDLASKDYIKNIDFIIPVPLHKIKLKKRGYNQISTFCAALSEQLNIPVLENLILKSENTTSQSKLNKEQRVNQKLVFELTKHTENLKGKHFLLVDDIITTGATIVSCAKNLLQIENAKASIISMAYSK